MIYSLKASPEIPLLLYHHVWEGVWKQKQVEWRHGWEGAIRIFPGIIFCLAVFLDFYQRSSVLRGHGETERDSSPSSLKSPTTHQLLSSHTHTHITPSSVACRTCSGACNRNTMSNAGENSPAKLSMSTPRFGL